MRHGRFGSTKTSPGDRVLERISRGFTLIELLVVILIILLVSAVALPTVIPAITHRQVSEAARILQADLVGARDAAINTVRPAGIRLLPDPVFIQQMTEPIDGQPGRSDRPVKGSGGEPIHPHPARARLFGGDRSSGGPQAAQAVYSWSLELLSGLPSPRGSVPE